MFFLLGLMLGLVAGTVIVYHASKSSYETLVKSRVPKELAKPENHVYLPVNNACCVICGNWKDSHHHTIDTVYDELTNKPDYSDNKSDCKTC